MNPRYPVTSQTYFANFGEQPEGDITQVSASSIPEHVQFGFGLALKSPKPLMRDILDKDVDEKYTLSDKLGTYLQNYAANHKASGNGFGYGIAPLTAYQGQSLQDTVRLLQRGFGQWIKSPMRSSLVDKY